MNIAIFDTETIGVEKLFCYNVGWVIVDTETETILSSQDYVVEQIWHNLELFSTAYYADKRPIYVSRMRKKSTIMDKFGYITRQMAREFKQFNVEAAFAYNSNFDERVFQFNCDWFKVINPFDNIPIYDIRGHVHRTIAFTEDYQAFCREHQLFTDAGNYSTTAENVYRFLVNDPDFEEEHTALQDSLIEWEVLNQCVLRGAEYCKRYKVYNSISNPAPKVLEITTMDKEKMLIDYEGIIINKSDKYRTRIYLKRRGRA